MNGYAHPLSLRSTRTWSFRGYYHYIIQTGEKREYGELHLRKLHDVYHDEIVVDNNIAMGRRHELPALAQGTTTETAMVTTELTETVQDPIVSDDTPRHEE
jgi:hypothetical protein